LKTSPLDDRVENLQKVVDELSEKLNKFETKNKNLLNNVRVSTNKESSREPAFENQESKANKAKVAKAAVKDNLQSLASQQAEETNKLTVAKEAIKDNKQAIASSQTMANKATVAKETIKDNNQAIASSAVASNKAGVKKEAIEDNKQAIASSQTPANKATVEKEAIEDNNQAIASSAVSSNKAGVKKEAIEDNLQPALDKANTANKASVAKEAIKDNNQAIASSTVASNKARVKKEAIEDNLQSIAVKPVNANDASVAKVGFSSNRQPVANGSQILDASIASNPTDDAPVNSSDALDISSAGVFASQSETDRSQSSAETQIETSAAMEAPITFKKRQSPLASIFRNKQPSKYSFKFYARVLATFFVMSLWTSNIAATRLDMGSMVFGLLMRISPDQLDLR
jgi:hypothetical protein